MIELYVFHSFIFCSPYIEKIPSSISNESVKWKSSTNIFTYPCVPLILLKRALVYLYTKQRQQKQYQTGWIMLNSNPLSFSGQSDAYIATTHRVKLYVYTKCAPKFRQERDRSRGLASDPFPRLFSPFFSLIFVPCYCHSSTSWTGMKEFAWSEIVRFLSIVMRCTISLSFSVFCFLGR